ADKGAAQYVAEFSDGPLEGEFEHRVLVGGKPESRVGMMAAVDGLESLFWYDAVDEREVNGQLRVRFRFDADDSDPVEFDEDENRWRPRATAHVGDGRRRHPIRSVTCSGRLSGEERADHGRRVR